MNQYELQARCDAATERIRNGGGRGLPGQPKTLATQLREAHEVIEAQQVHITKGIAEIAASEDKAAALRKEIALAKALTPPRRMTAAEARQRYGEIVSAKDRAAFRMEYAKELGLK